MNNYLFKNQKKENYKSPINQKNKEELKKIVECSTVRHLRSNQINDQNWLLTEKKFIESLIKTDNFLKRYLSENPDYDLFFALNGQFANSNLFLKYAEFNNKNFLTYERGNIKNSIVFSRNKNAVPFTMKTLWEKHLNIKIDEKKIQNLKKYLESRESVGNGHVSFYPTINNDTNKIIKDLNLNTKNKTYVLFTNLIWDSSVYGQDVVFKDMYQWISETISFFMLNLNLNLIIRIHPAEERVSWWKTRYTTRDHIISKFSNLTNNIKIIEAKNDISSYKLMDISDVGLVYTSTTGLEMAYKNKPVIGVANSHYSNLKLIYEPCSSKQYFNYLMEKNKPLQNQVTKIEKYLYLLYFEKMLKIDDINEDIKYGFEYKIKSSSNISKKTIEQISNEFKI